MKVSKESLAVAVAFASSVVKSKTTAPICSTLRLEASKGTLTVSACDFEQHCTITCDCDGDLNPCCVPMHSLKTVLPLFSDNVDITNDGERLKIKSGGSFCLNIFNVKEWPAWESDKPKKLKVSSEDLAAAVKTVSFAVAASDESRTILQNVHVFSDSKVFAIEATTARELACINKPAIDDKFDFCLPAPFITNACRAMEVEKSSVWISDKKLTVKFSSGEYSCKLSEGVFPSTKIVLNDKRTAIGEIEPSLWQNVFSSCISLSGIDAALICRFVMADGKITHEGKGGFMEVKFPQPIKLSDAICSDSKSALACFKAMGDGKAKMSISESKYVFLERDELAVCFSQLRK